MTGDKSSLRGRRTFDVKKNVRATNGNGYAVRRIPCAVYVRCTESTEDSTVYTGYGIRYTVGRVIDVV